jgi:hypothetical protein
MGVLNRYDFQRAKLIPRLKFWKCVKSLFDTMASHENGRDRRGKHNENSGGKKRIKRKVHSTSLRLRGFFFQRWRA